MEYHFLVHDGRLGVSPQALYAIPHGWSPPEGCTALLTFRPWGVHTPHDVVDGVNATTRFRADYGKHVCLHSLENDSFLAPLILWDVVHKMPVGGMLTLIGMNEAPYLSLPYYTNGLQVSARTAQSITYTKTAPLLIEQDRGLSRWTFGLPTGPGDAIGLNAVVQRILELGIPEFEIILCGRPGPGFKYFDKVTIVGEELSKPPVLIGKKKNVIADAAKYENLCILHDRVFLPKDFYEAVQKYGDDYSMTTLQALWFDDPHHLIPKRYSDYNRISNAFMLGKVTTPQNPSDFYAQDLFAIDPDTRYYYAHPLRYHRMNYCNGSLYISKRSLWQTHPQSNTLKWAQYEDVEHGLRLSALGVPSRVNPHAFSQSLFARVGLLGDGIEYEFSNGAIELHVSPLEAMNFTRKPLIRKSIQDAHEGLLTFARKYVPDSFREHVIGEVNKPAASTLDWLRKLSVVIYAASPRFGEESITEFISDVERYIVCDSISSGAKKFFLESFSIHGGLARDNFVENSLYHRVLLFRRRTLNAFYTSLAEYFPTRTWKHRWGTSWTAKRLAKHNGQLFYHPGGRDDYQRALENSTPYREYYEAAI